MTVAQKNADIAKGIKIDKRITANHKYGDETAILRKTLYALIHGLPIPQEFEAYYAEAEGIKASVKEELGID